MKDGDHRSRSYSHSNIPSDHHHHHRNYVLLVDGRTFPLPADVAQ